MMTVHFIWVILVRYGAIYNKMPKKFWDLSAAAYVPYRKLDILGLLESQCFRKATASDTSKQTSITGDWQHIAKESTTRISRYLGLASKNPQLKKAKKNPYTSWLFMTFLNHSHWLAGPSLEPLELAWDSNRLLCGSEKGTCHCSGPIVKCSVISGVSVWL